MAKSKEELKIYNQQYYAKNKQKLLEKAHAYSASHKAEKREYDKRTYQLNIEKVKIYQKKYREKQKNKLVLISS
tara:strand:+ start:880 stop:1101 length:222 start_codon:yes stop_codon:yes gene_type:complete